MKVAWFAAKRIRTEKGMLHNFIEGNIINGVATLNCYNIQVIITGKK